MTLKSLLLSTIAGVAMTIAAPLAASAADCERGTLDERYCDVDGDLIADIPTDEADLIDPDTLIFAYTPVEDPCGLSSEAWADFLTHLDREVTGKKSVQFFPVQSNAAQIEAMRSGPPAHCGLQHRLQSACGELCRLPPLHHHGLGMMAASATRWRS
jgi:phosphonate transport system substrate-binding protein